MSLARIAADVDRYTSEDAVRQAKWTVEEYFKSAVKTVSDYFGPAYAREHPELILGLVDAMLKDYEMALPFVEED